MSDFKYEDLLLDRALQYLTEKYGKEGLQYRSVLYLECRDGRFMPRLSALFSSVTGLEPDEELCDEAMERILDQDLENATALCMDLETYIREFPNQMFDVVLCSQAFQHMKHETACSILETLKNVIGPDSVCLFTTTFTDSRRNAYTAEFLQDGEKKVLDVDERGFEDAVDAPDRKAVCLFSRPWMERFLLSCGLKTKQFQTAEKDALYVCEPAEGTLLRRSCGPETASGKVCYMYYYYLSDSAGMNTAKLRRLQEEEDEDTDEIRDAFEAAENFLYADGMPFPVLRHYRKTEIRCRKVSVADSHTVVSFYPGNGIAQVSVCLTLEDVPCDDFVYLHQIQCADEDLFTVDGEPGSILQLCENVLKECGLRDPNRSGTSFIAELNRFGNCTDPLALTPDYQRCLCGILTGDEGYLHIPQALVEKRMTGSWTGKDFARVIALGSNYVLLNFNRGETYADYIDYQLPYAEHYFGELNRYFTMDAPTAGINHGLFFSAETGQVIRTVIQRLTENAIQSSDSHGVFGANGIKRSKQVRAEMLRTLHDLDRVNDAGLSALDGLVLDGLGMTRRIESIRDSLFLLI